jgi:hypothetical protein
MTRTGSTNWSPEHDLATLLDALMQEVLGASDRDVTMLVREAGVAPEMIARDMRRLMAAAEAGLVAPLAAGFATPGLRAFVVRNQ